MYQVFKNSPNLYSVYADGMFLYEGSFKGIIIRFEGKITESGLNEAISQIRQGAESGIIPREDS